MSNKVLAGRYELFERIGEGGMSVVYKAKDKLLNRFVAIKILKPEFINDHKFIDSFRRESQAAASLSHPNIVNIYDVGREEHTLHSNGADRRKNLKRLHKRAGTYVLS